MGWTNEAGRACLLEVVDALEELEIPFFLIQGTALGAYRDGGFVPNEADIDLGVLQEHLAHKARPLVDLLIRREFQIDTYALPFRQVRTIVAWKYGVHADIVGFISWKKVRFTCSPVHPTVIEPYAIVHPRGRLEGPYHQVKVFDRIFNLPSTIETYLEAEYGPEWRVPRKDHVSRTRVYDFINKENIPHDYLPPQP